MATIPISTVTTTASAIASLTAGVPPLTTVFTAPAACSTNWVYATDDVGTVWGDSDSIPDFNLCQPYDNDGTVYAPGICASGLELKQVTELIETGSDPPLTYWHGLCCSSDFDVSVVSGTQSMCVGSFPAPFTALVSIDDDDPSFGFTTTVLTTDVLAVSDLFEVYWQETDVGSFPTDSQVQLRAIMGLPTTTSSVIAVVTTDVTTIITTPVEKPSIATSIFITSVITSITTSTPTPTSTQTPSAATSRVISGATTSATTSITTSTPTQTTPAATTAEPETGLATGAVAGISVAIGVLFMVVVILSYFACFRRRRRGSTHSRQQGYGDLGSEYIPREQQRSFWPRRFRTSAPNTAGPPPVVVTNIPPVSELWSPPELGKTFEDGAWRSELHYDSAAARGEERGSVGPVSIVEEGGPVSPNRGVSSLHNVAPIELEAWSPVSAM